MSEHKIVNLDDAAKSVTITLGGESFTISRVTLEMRQLYGEYIIFSGQYYDRAVKYSAEAIESLGLPELEKKDKELSEAVETFAIGKAEKIEAMLGLILKKNGYEYKPEWWQSNTDYQGMEAFIVEAMNKDSDGAQSKKKEAAS